MQKLRAVAVLAAVGFWFAGCATQLPHVSHGVFVPSERGPTITVEGPLQRLRYVAPDGQTSERWIVCTKTQYYWIDPNSIASLRKVGPIPRIAFGGPVYSVEGYKTGTEFWDRACYTVLYALTLNQTTERRKPTAKDGTEIVPRSNGPVQTFTGYLDRPRFRVKGASNIILCSASKYYWLNFDSQSTLNGEPLQERATGETESATGEILLGVDRVYQIRAYEVARISRQRSFATYPVLQVLDMTQGSGGNP